MELGIVSFVRKMSQSSNCKICEWVGRLEFDSYYQTVRPSLRSAAQWARERGLGVTYATVRTHIPHLRGDKKADSREISSGTIEKLAAEHNITLDPCAVDTAIEYQQQILSQIVTLTGIRCLAEVKEAIAKNVPFPLKTAQAYSLLFGMFAKVTALEKIVDVDAAAATMQKYYGEAKVIEAVVDV
jgi:hypothetical protein